MLEREHNKFKQIRYIVFKVYKGIQDMLERQSFGKTL